MRSLITVAFVFFRLVGVNAAAQEQLRDPVLESWRDLEKVQECANCHVSPRGFAEGPRVTEFSRRTEALFWAEHDKHAIARRRVEPLTADQIVTVRADLQSRYSAFAQTGRVEEWVGPSNRLSRTICDALGYDVDSPGGYAQFRAHCLTCHGGYTPEHPGADTAFAKEGIQPGISCNYCHQIGANESWVRPHSERAWRMQPPTEKEKLGQRNLVATEQQAQLCLSCHVGNAQEGKFLTHAMYAAGHPPLPSFELRTFSAQMPQHWRTSAELHDALSEFPEREAYFRLQFPGVMGEDPNAILPSQVYWDTRDVLIGAVAARKQFVQLLADATHGDRWGDFALYDCSACHHELRTVSLRQERGYSGFPGRPRPAEWPDALLPIALRRADRTDTWRSADASLLATFDRQPFGDSDLYANAVPAALAELDRALRQLVAMPIDRDMAEAVFLELLNTPRAHLADYHSARQVVWAVLAIAKERSSHGLHESDAMRDALRRLGEGDRLWGGIASELPAGRSRFIYPDFLASELQRRSDYEPQRLLEQFRIIREESGTAAR